MHLNCLYVNLAQPFIWAEYFPLRLSPLNVTKFNLMALLQIVIPVLSEDFC